jgi:RNA polymerase sigma factor (sigma-70 family)
VSDDVSVENSRAEHLTPQGISWLEERELVRRFQTGDARDRDRALRALLKAFRPFLRARIAEAHRSSVDLGDLEQEALLGFVRAVERFDLTRTTRLSSYAQPWVQGRLRRFVAKDRVIHIPEQPARELAHLRSVMREYSEALGAEASLNELADATGQTAGRILELLQIPDGVVSLSEIIDGEAATTSANRPGGWARTAAALIGDAEEEVHSDIYNTGEVGSLVDEYQGLRSQLEVRTTPFEEPRLRPRGSHVSTLVRLVDLDRALQRVSGKQFVALELAGLRDLQLRKLEEFLGVRHTTLADRKKAGVKWVCAWLNGNTEADVRRHVFWRRLFAWNLGELLVFGEPVAFEVVARLGAARELWTGTRSIPVRAMEVFGEGWLLTPELLGRETDWGEDTDAEAEPRAASPALHLSAPRPSPPSPPSPSSPPSWPA